MESRGASAEELESFIGSGQARARQGKLEGDLVSGEAYAGANAGMITETLSAGEIVRRIIEDSESTLLQLSQVRQGF